MIPWKFLAFCGLMGGIFYLHFFFSHLQWRRVRGQVPSDVDPNYVKRENYFGQSFRSKVKAWLELPDSTPDEGGGRIIRKGRETIRVTTQMRMPSQTRSDDVLVIEGDFACGAGCELSREIYAQGKAEIGSGSQVQAIAADEDLTLDAGVTVARWVDCAGELRLGRSSVVHSRATSRKAVRLEMGAEVFSVFAPEVESWIEGDVPARNSLPTPARVLQLPPPNEQASDWKQVGFDIAKLSAFGTESWIYSGSLRSQVPVRLLSKLVVRGDCVCPPGSILEQDLKASGLLAIGEGSECRGNLIAGKSVYLGPRARFAGVIHAGADILLSSGVRGAPAEAFVAAYAGSSFYLESGVMVHGKLSAGKYVKVVPHEFTDQWRRQHKIDELSGRCD